MRNLAKWGKMVAAAIAMLLAVTQNVSAQSGDNPPEIISNPMDSITTCDQNVSGTFIRWLAQSGFSATGGLQNRNTLFDRVNNEAAREFINDLIDAECDNANLNVRVGFFATNATSISDTVFATFSFSDTTGVPVDTIPAENLTINCSDVAENMMVNWIRNGGGAVVTDDCRGAIPWTEFSWTSGDRGSRGNVVDGPFDNIIDETVCDQVINFTFFGENMCDQFEVSQSATFTLMLDSAMIIIDTLPQDLALDCADEAELAITNWYGNAAGMSATSFISTTQVNAVTPLDTIFQRVEEFRATGCRDYQISVGFMAVDTFMNESETVFAMIDVSDDDAPSFTSTASSVVLTCRDNIQDSLNAWISNFGGAVATDICSDSVIWTTYSWSGDGRSSSGNLDGSTFDNILNSNTCDQTYTFTFNVEDICGNASQTMASFQVVDTAIVIRPAVGVSLPCASFPDAVGQLTSWYNSSAGFTATTQGRNLVPMANKTLDEAIAEYNTSLMNGCAEGMVDVGFFALDDEGNSSDTSVATFMIMDETGPTFSSQPSDLVFDCAAVDSAGVSDWILAYGGAVAIDDCSDSVIWSSFSWSTTSGDNGSGDFVDGPFEILDGMGCFDTAQVTFFVADLCGNSNTITALFSIRDTTPLMDTIRPMITADPMDVAVDCTDDISEELRSWYDTAGGLMATDENGVIKLDATQSFTATLNEFNSSNRMSGCADGTVTVGFFALDTLDNSSDTLFATFSVLDTLAPTIVTLPSDLSISCNAGSQDSLTNWITRIGGAVASDDCSSDEDVLWSSYSYADSEGNSGSGSFINGPFNILGQNLCNWSIDVDFIVTDACGNTAVTSATFSIEDTEAPQFPFTLPDTTLNCDNVPSATAIVAEDACQGQIMTMAVDSSTQSMNDSICEFFNYKIYRTYTASDDCGNANSFVQIITISDTLEPRYTAPMDITISCLDDTSPEVTGEPINIRDNCSSDVVITFTDSPEGEGCNMIINRAWSIRDLCGSSLLLTQVITISDTLAPAITQVAEDVVMNCESAENVDQAFADWVDNLGGASATDECANSVTTFAATPGSYDINDPSTYPGDAPGMLDFVQCPSEVIGDYRAETVDFVFVDGCGNASVSTASFKIIDEIAPEISGGLTDTTLIVEGNGCEATLVIPALAVSDLCGDLENTFTMTDRYDISSSELGSEQIPVDSFRARFGPFDPSDLDASQMITLTVQMINMDADDPTEYFSIVAEDGTDLGRTPRTPVQCGDAEFELTFTMAQIMAWGTDGFIDIDFIPNIPDGSGALAINDVCFGTGSMMLFSIEVDIAVEDFVGYEIQIDDNEPVVLNNIEDYTATIESGDHTVTYIVTDCAGNASTASFDVTVAESTPPSITCPADQSIGLITGNCTINYNLPGASGLTDNCSLSDTFQYSVTGATEIMTTSYSRTQSTSIVLEKGINTITYIASDGSGNTADCSFQVTVVDSEDPMVICRDTSVAQAHPSGLLPLIIDEAVVVASVTDNCEVGEFSFADNDFNCSSIGDFVAVTIIASDASGNTSTCTSQVRITPFDLEPMAQSLVCTGDTLRLFANVPAIEDMSTYGFSWTGPNDFTSTLENPVIPNSTPNLSGEYTVVVTGANGCSSEGSVRVTIEDFNSPEISVDQLTICAGDTVMLRGTNFQSEVTYKWYQGRPPSGMLIAETTEPTYRFAPSGDETSYYLTAENEACETTPSGVINITVNAIPDLGSTNTTVQICERGSFQLRAGFEGGTNTIYSWTGPNEFTSDMANPPSFDNATPDQSGEYTLIVDDNGCISAPRTTRVTVQPFPATPVIRTDEVVCEGSNLILFTADTLDVNGTLNWLLNGELYESVDGNGLVIQNVTDSLQGLWQVFVQDEACISDTSSGVLVTVEELLDIEIFNDTILCETDEVQLEATLVQNASYSWSGPNNFRANLQNPIANVTEGTYTVTVTTEAGCESTSALTINTIPRPMVLSVSEEEVNECVDGTFDITVSVTAGPDTDYDFQWEGPNGFTLEGQTLVIPNATAAQSGTYSLVVENDICESEVQEVMINLTDIPARPSLGENRDICVGEALSLVIENIDSTIERYVWTTPMGMFETTEPTFEIPEIGIANAGVYLVRADDKGCVSSDSDLLIVNVFSIPRAPGVSSNGPVCEGDDLILQAGQVVGADYLWTGPNGFTAQGDRVVVRNTDPSLEGDYSVVIILNGCPSPPSTLSNVEFLPTPVKPVTEVSVIEVCMDEMSSDNVMLCINSPQYNSDGEYQWMNETTGEILGITSDRCLTLSEESSFVIGENSITVEEVNDVCNSPSSDVISFIIYEPLDEIADGGDDIIACDISNIILSANNPNRGTGRWRALDPDINFSDPTDPNSLVFDINEGQNVLIWQIENGACVGDIDTVIVSTEFSIVANDDEFQTAYNTDLTILPDVNDDLPEEYELQIITQPRAGVVRMGLDGLEFTPENGFLGPAEIVYEVCSVICPDNCDRATVTIEVGDVTDCFAPSLITPNGDGINDTFVIPCIESGLYPNNQLYIYNQYGDQVLDAPSYNNDWNGQYNGEDLPTGTYYYVFRANNQLAAEKGFIIIER